MKNVESEQLNISAFSVQSDWVGSNRPIKGPVQYRQCELQLRAGNVPSDFE